MKFENLWARGLHEQQFDYHLRVTAESVSEHDQRETELMAFPLVRGHSVQLRQRVYPSLHEREIFACGIRNPGLWIRNPSSTDKDWNSVSEIRNPRRGIQNLDSPYFLTWGDTLKIRKILVVISAPSRLVFPGKGYFQRKHPNISNNKDSE